MFNPEAQFCNLKSPERLHRFDGYAALVVQDDVARGQLQGLEFNPDAFDTRDIRVADEPLIKHPDSISPEDFDVKLYDISTAIWGEAGATLSSVDRINYLFELNEELSAIERNERRVLEAELRAQHHRRQS